MRTDRFAGRFAGGVYSVSRREIRSSAGRKPDAHRRNLLCRAQAETAQASAGLGAHPLSRKKNLQ